MKLLGILMASVLVFAAPVFVDDGHAQDRYSQDHRPAHPPPTPEASTHFTWATVLRVDPVYDDIEPDASPSQPDCVDERHDPPPPSGPATEHSDKHVGGTIIGAVVGGVIGSLFGKGDGRKATIAAGAVAGGIAGNSLAAADDARSAPPNSNATSSSVPGDSVFHDVGENTEPPPSSPPPQAVQRRCRDVQSTSGEHRIVGYDVEYNYKGEIYLARLPYDPGDRLRVKVSVTPAD